MWQIRQAARHVRLARPKLFVVAILFVRAAQLTNILRLQALVARSVQRELTARQDLRIAQNAPREASAESAVLVHLALKGGGAARERRVAPCARLGSTVQRLDRQHVPLALQARQATAPHLVQIVQQAHGAAMKQPHAASAPQEASAPQLDRPAVLIVPQGSSALEARHVQTAKRGAGATLHLALATSVQAESIALAALNFVQIVLLASMAQELHPAPIARQAERHLWDQFFAQQQ